MIKVYPNRIPIRADALTSAQFVDNEWQIKTGGPKDEALVEGSYTVLRADGTVIRRTIDRDGFIIHELIIKEGTSDV